jgi:hypothetical protein
MTLFIIIGLLVLGLVWVRFAPNDITKWHFDPSVEYTSKRPNYFQQDYTLETSIDDLIAKWQTPERGSEKLSILAGDLQDGFVTYMVRTPLIGYPDYVSIKIAALDSTTTSLKVLSRSRFGRSDLGLNKKRISAWIVALRDAL